ncbi:MAG: protein kinase [Polyangiaceae bacterium]|nr:protein kinase [Polyangiaceae bacterium]
MSAAITANLPNGGLFQGRYQVIRCIKSGGMGSVYEVLDEKTASRRALKVMLPQLLSNDALRARFELEAKITGSIESDHLVRVLDAGVDAESKMPFLVMELLRGEDLASVTQNRGVLPPEEVVLYIFQTARALDKTHAANVVHRDLKPDNLFLTVRDDDTPCIKILDFGIAKATDVAIDGVQTRPMMGTPLYMSPEQMRAEKVGAPTDIYALAQIAYALLTGEPYWKNELDESPSPFLLAVEVLQGVQELPSVRALRRRNVQLPRAFDDWFIKATARLPDERFARASLAAGALAEVFGIESPGRFSHLPAFSRTEAPPPGAQGAREAAPKIESAPPPVQIAPNDPLPFIDTGVASGAPDREAPLDLTEKPRQPAAPVPAPRESGVRQAAALPKTNPNAPVAAPNKPPAKTEAVGNAPVTGVGLKKKGFIVEVDVRRAIVKVKVWGFWTLEDGHAYVDEFKRAAAKVIGRPWYVLADISEFTAQKPEVSALVEQTMSYATSNGLVKAANLVSSSLGKMQIARLSQAMGLPEFSFFQTERQAIDWLLGSAA